MCCFSLLGMMYREVGGGMKKRRQRRWGESSTSVLEGYILCALVVKCFERGK